VAGARLKEALQLPSPTIYDLFPDLDGALNCKCQDAVMEVVDHVEGSLEPLIEYSAVLTLSQALKEFPQTIKGF